MGFSDNMPCTIEDVVSLTGITVVKHSGNQLHCRCPFCADTKAHLNVKLSSNVFRCNRCGRGGGMLHLYAGINEISLSAAYEELCSLYKDGKKPICRTRVLSGQGNIIQPEMPLASSAVRDNTYRNLLSLLSLGSKHRESLRERGLSDAQIDQLNYRTTPAVRSQKIVTELLERGCNLQGVPGFYCDRETGCWKLDIRASGILIPDVNLDGEIEALQIRLDQVHHSKFNNLTSVDRYYGTPATCCPHYIGALEKIESIVLTEGIMKADVAYYLSREMGKTITFVGITGVGNTSQLKRAICELKQLGISRINLAFDMDYCKNENVMTSRNRAIEYAESEGVEVTPLKWNSDLKGIDDLLLYFLKRQQEGIE